MTTVKRRRLKSDHFGSIWYVDAGENEPRRAVRDLSRVRWWIRPFARYLASREARALRVLEHVAGTPLCLSYNGTHLEREWIDGQPMQVAQPSDPAYFREAMRLVRRLHRHGVAHNDLAKETNWLVTPDGRPALVDFQLAWTTQRRGPLFRALAHDDLRHLLKHKRRYLPERLTGRERAVLARRSLLNRIWMASGKRIYLFVTRRILHWSDREGAGDRRF